MDLLAKVDALQAHFPCDPKPQDDSQDRESGKTEQLSISQFLDVFFIRLFSKKTCVEFSMDNV